MATTATTASPPEGCQADFNKYCVYQRTDQSLNVPMSKACVWYQVNTTNKETKEVFSEFATGEVISETPDDALIRTGEGQEIRVKKTMIFPRNPARFDGVDDCAELGQLNEPCVLYNLRLRYNANIIHTYSGLFCVVINPYKRFPIYTPFMIERYRGRRRNELPPHIFAIGDGAYRAMMQSENLPNQSILITGESGAGKTENTKKVIQYLTNIAGKGDAGALSQLERQLLDANPVLESFGNAKTCRNNNSSRFGKFIKIFFTTGGHICGGNIKDYLLEKSRVVSQANNERNYHIFYQLMAGSSPELKRQLKLTGPNDYFYMNQGGNPNIAGVDDAKDFQDLKRSLSTMNVSEEEQSQIWNIISGLLHLGNVKFTEGREGCELPDSTELELAAEMFGVGYDVFKEALMKPKTEVQVGGKIEQMCQHLTMDKAFSSRNALARTMFQRLFKWIVWKINKELNASSYASFIGVLDIAGFEIFPLNSFEQLCINYTNECLQQFFNFHMFTLEQEEYMAEKLDYTPENYAMDSQPVIDLIEEKPGPRAGILALLDEQSFLGGAGTDDQFLQKLYGTFGRRGRVPHFKFHEPQFSGAKEFGVDHYAGPVNYSIVGWIDKNRDPLTLQLEKHMRTSNYKLVSHIWTEQFDLAGGSAAATARKGAGFQTVGAKHKEQLNDLMTTLRRTTPHFVRCILPNKEQKAALMHSDVVLKQLKCNGVLEGIRISRKGFPNRVMYAEFLKRYYFLATGVPRATPDTKATVQILMEQLHTPKERYQMGLTKIFFRTGMLAEIEEMRERKISEMIITLQAACRALLGRKNFLELRKKTIAVLTIQANLRAWIQFKEWSWWRLFMKIRPQLKRVNLDLELKKLQKELEVVKAEKDTEVKNKTQVLSQLAEAETQIGNLNKQITASRGDMDSLQAERDRLESDKRDLTNKASSLDDDIMHLKQRELQVKGELEKQLAEYTKLEDELTVAKKQQSQLQGMVERFKGMLGEANNANDEYEKAITTLEANKTDLTKQIADLNGEIDESNKIKVLLEKTRRKLETDIQDLTAALKKETGEKTEIIAAKKALEGQLVQLNQNLAGEQANSQALQGSVKKLEGMLADMTAKFEAEKATHTTVEKTLKDTSNELVTTRDDLESERTQRATLEGQKRSLQSELQKLQEEVEKGFDQSLQTQEWRKKAEFELGELRKEIERLTALANKLEKEKKALELELADARKNLDGALRDKANLERAKRGVDTELESLKEKLEIAERERTQLSQNSRRLASEAVQAKAAFDDLTATKTNLEASLKSTESSLAETHEELEQLKRDKEALEKKKSSIESDLKTMTEQFEDEKKNKEQLDRKKRSLEEEFDRQRQDLEQSEGDLHHVEAERKTLAGKVDDLEKKIAAETDAKNRAVETQRTQIKSIEDLRQELEELEATKSKLARDNAKLGSELEAEIEAKDFEKKNFLELKKTFERLSADFKATKAKLDEQTAAASEYFVMKNKLETELANVSRDIELQDTALAAANRAKKGLEVEVTGLKDQLSVVEAAASTAKNKIKELEGQVADLHQQILEKGDGVDSAVVAAKEQEIMDLKAKLKTETDAKQTTEENRKQLRTELQEAKAALEIAKAKEEGFERAKRNLEQEVAAARSSADLAAKKAKMSEEMIQNLQANVKGLKLASIVSSQGEEAQRLAYQSKELLVALDEQKKLLGDSEVARKALDAQLAELKAQLVEEGLNREKQLKDKRTIEVALEETRDQLEEAEERASAGEEGKRKAEVELDDLKKRYENDLDQKQRLEVLKGVLEKDVEKFKAAFEEEHKQRLESDRIKNRLGGEAEDLTVRLDNEVKAKTALDHALRKLQREARVIKTKLDTQLAQMSDLETGNMKMEEELDDIKMKLERETKSRVILEKTKQQMEMRIEELTETSETDVKLKQRLEKEKRDLQVELDDLKEIQDELDEMKQQFDDDKAKLEAERNASREEVDKLTVQVDDLELAKAKMTRDHSELNEKLAEESSQRTQFERSKKQIEEELEETQRLLEAELRTKAKFEKAVRDKDRALADAKTSLATAQAAAQKGGGTATLEAANRRLKAELDEIRTEIQAAAAEKKKMDVERTLLQEQLQDEREQNETIRNQLAGLFGGLTSAPKRTGVRKSASEKPKPDDS
ncbi:major plasmodial myosin heavy chain [Pelomyxa schiedti]|nr:major plasmodial myosin heavy chain [Pelomyxa schiedti]